MYAIGAGNLASHFGKVTAEPVADYVAGQVNHYTATIYLGSTYNEPAPAAFLTDVLSTTHPVIWAGSNIWQLTGTEGSTADRAFKTVYGWDPSNSYIDTADNPVTVSYKGQTFSRNASNGADILAPDITTASLVTVLAQANCTAGCAPIAQTTGTSFPWAIRSSNLTYVRRRSHPPGAGPARGRRPHGEPDRAPAVRGLPVQPARAVQRRGHPRVHRPPRLLQRR